MKRRTPVDFAEYLEIFARRWHVLAIPLAASLFLTLLIGGKLPKYYRSETVVMLDPQKVPLDIVKSDAFDLSRRLQLINQQILSRTQLEKIIKTFNLYPDAKGTSDEIVERLRKDISLEVVRDSRIRDSNVTAFRLAYVSRSPKVAQDVTRQLGSLYIEENLKVREQIAEGTHEFIDEELRKAREDLQKQEQAMTKFKSEHMGALPQQEASNLQLIAQYQALLQTNAEGLNRAQQQKQYLQSLLEVSAPKAVERNQALETAKMELAAAEQKYTASHPDVVRLRAQVGALEHRQVSVAKESSTPQIASQLAALDEELKTRAARANEMEAKLGTVRHRVEALPMIEQQFTELSRDYEVSRSNYQALLQKKNQSGMTVEMERDAKGENFRILDPASLPQKPYKPNMLLVLAAGLMSGAVVGSGLAFIMEMRDHGIHSDVDLQHYLPVPVLAVMPVIHTAESWAEARRSRRRKWTISAVAVGACCLLLAALMVRGTIDLANWI